MADTRPILKDYKHASKLFVDDHFNFVPKSSYLYHVYFDLTIKNALVDSQNPNGDRELGMLVKAVSLPKFSIESKIFNAYNRPNIVQTKLKYDPVQITFHDDSADLVRNFWFDYCNYYYRDSDHDEALYHQEHKYQDKIPTSGWGYTTRSDNSEPYIQSIRIYSLHHKRFSEYILINPLIKSFRHGDHRAGDDELMTHEMTIDYETVLYSYGAIGQSTIAGFAQLHYDLDPSPLTAAGGGSLGVYDTTKEIVNDLRAGEYTLAAKAAANGISNGVQYLTDATKSGISTVSNWVDRGADIIKSSTNTNASVFVPSLQNTNTPAATTGINQYYVNGQYVGDPNYSRQKQLTNGLATSDVTGRMQGRQEVTQQSNLINGAPESARQPLVPRNLIITEIPAVSGQDTTETPMNMSVATGGGVLRPGLLKSRSTAGTGEVRAGKIHYPDSWNDTQLTPPPGYTIK